MMKKQYVKMTVQCERFDLSEAISAGCSYELLMESARCEDCCDALDRYGFHDQHHSWMVFGHKKDDGTWENGTIGLSVGSAAAYGRAGEYSSSCLTNVDKPIVDGDAVMQTSNVRVGYFDPVDEAFHVNFISGVSAGSGGNILYNNAS